MNVKFIRIRRNTKFWFSLLLPYNVILLSNSLFNFIQYGILIGENLKCPITFPTNESIKSVKFTFMCAVSITFTTIKRPLLMLESNWKKKREKNIIWWCHTQNIIIGCRDIPFAFRLNAICQKSTKISTHKMNGIQWIFGFRIFSIVFQILIVSRKNLVRSTNVRFPLKHSIIHLINKAIDFLGLVRSVIKKINAFTAIITMPVKCIYIYDIILKTCAIHTRKELTQ